MRRWFYTDFGGPGSLGLLVLRVVAGAGIAIHGWPKIQNAYGWMGPEATVAPAMQALAALGEFAGGLALIAGLLTRLAALGIAGVMVGALAIVHVPRGDPFVSMTGGPSSELAALYLACSVLFILAGPGRFSLDALLFGGATVSPPPSRGAVPS
jgi:putative oxidoreductase